MKALYFECYSGISGDMTVAALLDLGADQAKLEKALQSLHVGGITTKISRVTKSGIAACDFDVIPDAAHDGHDHDMRYLYGTREEAEEVVEGIHAHAAADHTHQHHHHHEHRGMKEITEIIDAADLTEGARAMALKIFGVLADAEAAAHGVSRDEVHFHEVGAVDSIADIVAAAVCLDDLGIQDVYVPGIYEGCGTVRCQHGVLPVPVPAVANICSAYHIPMNIASMPGEYVTPTGAAIVAAAATSYEMPEHFTIQKIGVGAGKREYDGPGILRIMEIETEDA